jgi:general secretion pathway protein L
MKRTLKDRAGPWLRGFGATSAGLGARRYELRLPRGWPEVDPSVAWRCRAAEPALERAGRAENLSQLPDEVRAAAVHVWTPPADSLLTRAQLPTRSRARILQALPYALEDQLLDEPEALHFAFVREADGALAVAVTQRQRLNIWLEILKAAGIRPVSLAPGTLALPLAPDAWSAALVDGELWVRTGAHAGFVTVAGLEPPALLRAALAEAGAREAAPQRLLVHAPPPELDLAAWSAALALPVEPGADDFWKLARVPALNLLQAEFGQSAHLRQLARPLRPALVLLVLWVVASVALDVAEWWRLRARHQASQAEMHEIYRASFGTAAQYPYEQMRRGLETLRTGGADGAGLLPLLTRVAPALASERERLKIHSIKYGERALTLDLRLPDYRALDGLKNALRAAGVEVEVLAASGRGNEVEGRLRVQPGAPDGSRQPS